MEPKARIHKIKRLNFLSPLPRSRNTSYCPSVIQIQILNGQIYQQKYKTNSNFDYNQIYDYRISPSPKGNPNLQQNNNRQQLNKFSQSFLIKKNDEINNQLIQVIKKQSGQQKQKKQSNKKQLVRRLTLQQDQNKDNIYDTYLQLENVLNLPNNFNGINMTQNLQGSVQKILGIKQQAVLAQVLKKMLAKQMTKDQSKVYICRQLLISSLTIIRIYNQKKNLFSSANINPFKVMNSINKGILGYLKTKYPRCKNLFVPLQLQSKFKQVNFLAYSDYNTLQNAKITFTDNLATRKQRINKIKSFINLLMDQVDNNYIHFNKLLVGQLFQLSNQKDTSKIKYKIGRKIPQNTQRFTNFDNDNLQISSPQIFRVLIKWIQDMQTLLNQPSQVIGRRKQIKYIKKHYQDIINFSQIRSKRLQEIKVDLVQKISKQTIFKQKVNQLLNKLYTFNNNLTKTLNVRQCSTAFVRQQQAECLKFSKFNTQFLQWLIIQKILIIIKVLSKLSAQLQLKFFKTLDFINFNVYDLMRASCSGKRSLILQVFSNMKKLQKQQKLSIARLKNRLNTPLNDILINFKIPQSFLICQLQLILDDSAQEADQKLKIMEDINHLIYQLERSPYGPLSQMAISIGYHDPSIDYQDRISYKADWFKQEICSNGQIHQFFSVSDQTTPFVCSWCVSFYARLQNFFQYHQCKNCSLQKCKACVFKGDRDQQKKTYFKYLVSNFTGVPFQELDHQDDDSIKNFFQKNTFILEQYIRVRDSITMKGKTKLSSIQKLLYQKQVQYNLRGSDPFYCLLLHFSDGKCNIQILKYVNYQVFICMRSQSYHQGFKLQQYDVLFLLNPKIYFDTKGAQIVKHTFQDSKATFWNVYTKKKVIFKKSNCIVMYLKQGGQKILLDIIQFGYNNDQNQAQKNINNALYNTIAKCQDYISQRKQINLDKIWLDQKHLQILAIQNWKNQIKVLNISNNRITKINYTLQIFPNLQQLYVSFNLLTDITINNVIILSILDCSNNKLSQISQTINKCQNLSVLKINDNIIQQIPIFYLQNLDQLNLSKNKINNFQNLIKSKLNNLSILDISINNVSNNQQWFSYLSLPNIKRLQARDMKLTQQIIKFDKISKLQIIDCSDNNITSIATLNTKNIRQIHFLKNNIQNLQNVFINKLLKLEIIQLQKNKIKQFPILDLDSLLQIDLSFNKLQSINNLLKCNIKKIIKLNLQNNLLEIIDSLGKIDLPQIKDIFLQNNKIKYLPKLNFNNLVKLDLKQNKLVDVSLLTQSNLPKLKILLLRDNQLTKLPQLRFPVLKDFAPSRNKIINIDQFTKSNFLNINQIALWKNNLKCLPILQYPTLNTLYIYSNNLSDISQLEYCKFEQLQSLSLQDNQIIVLPLLKFPKLQKLYLYKNKIQNIDIMQKWQTPNLKLIQIFKNSIKIFPKISFKFLSTIQIRMNKLQNINNISKCQLPSLKKLFMNNNEIKQIPILNFQKLQQLQIAFNNIIQTNQFFNYSKLPLLKKLSLQNNKINILSKFQQFNNLEQLNLKSNLINNIQISIQCLKNLKKIILSDNKFTQWNQFLLSPCSLQQLSISKNIIEKCYIYDQNLKIRKLSMIDCKIKDIQMLYIPKVQQLYLQKNQISSAQFLAQPGAFESLIRLNIQRNKIEQLPLCQLHQLQEIYLQGNPIKNIEDFILSQLPKIKLMKLTKDRESMINGSSSLGIVAEDNNDQGNQQSQIKNQKINKSQQIPIEKIYESLIKAFPNASIVF